MINFCIRGAITIETDTKEEIFENTKLMLNKIIEKNKINISQIISIMFTATRDITAAYPAAAARELGITRASLMCAQEMYVAGSLPMCIRAEVSVNTDNYDFDPKHIYLKAAAKLRPDLSSKGFAVAIDGPSGAGKSSLARLIAGELGFIYIDTGAMYRTFGLYCLRRGILPEEAVKEKVDIDIKHVNGEQKIFLNGEDVTSYIRTQEIATAASAAAIVGPVRDMLVRSQQRLAASRDVVMDGRDIGTVVLPDADVKIYLDASSEKRAERRYKELIAANKPCDFETIKKEIEERDYIDMNRAISPLVKAEDATVVDTSSMTLEEVKKAVLDIINKRR